MGDADNQHLEKLKERIGKKVNNLDFEAWTHHQFEDLGEQIYQKTGVMLSTSTLKRFFGKVNTKSSASRSTRDALARYCGYDGYFDFVQNNPLPPGDTSLAEAPERRSLWASNARYVIFAGFLLAGFFAVIFYTKKQPSSLPEFHFEQAYDSGHVPFTQIFKYHVDPDFATSIYFQEGIKPPGEILTSDSIFSHMHFVPGFREVRFMTDRDTLWRSSYMVYSDGWLFIFPHGGLEPRKYIRLEETDGYLGISDELLAEHKIDLTEDGGWVNYFNMQDYEIPGDRFTLRSVLKNELKTGYQQCQDAIIEVECGPMKFLVHLTQKGCQKFAELALGHEYYGGVKNDLTSLTLDLNEWQPVVVETIGRTFRVSHGENVLIERTYTQQPGKVTGLRYSFRGNGMIREISLSGHGPEAKVYNWKF